MLGRNRVLLRSIINKEFSEGINKINLFNALERFIDFYYPTKGGEGVYFTYATKSKILHELAVDIAREGGLKSWKKKTMLLSNPIIGSVPSKKKKQK